jgi:hypothetical protein
MCRPEKSHYQNDTEFASRPGVETRRSRPAGVEISIPRDAALTASGSVSPSELAGNPLRERFSSLRRLQSTLSLQWNHAGANPRVHEDQRLSIKENPQLVKAKPKPFPIAQPIKNMEFKKLRREIEQGCKSEYIMQAERMQLLNKSSYKSEQCVPRKQTVLGLKYIHDRYGYHPRRRVAGSHELPKHIDHVSAYHNLTPVAHPPPPGLDTQPGQFARRQQIGTTVLCKFWHQRLRRSNPGAESRKMKPK